MKKFAALNILLSLSMFSFIFYSYAGISGGGIAIISANIMFGLIQLLLNSVYLRIKKSNFILKIQLTIVIAQIIELIVFIIYNYQINEWIKGNYS
jgi:hypothetical protein